MPSEARPCEGDDHQQQGEDGNCLACGVQLHGGDFDQPLPRCKFNSLIVLEQGMECQLEKRRYHVHVRVAGAPSVMHSHPRPKKESRCDGCPHCLRVRMPDERLCWLCQLPTRI